jgi:spermidine synthase
VLEYVRLQLGGAVAAFAGVAREPPSSVAVVGIGAGSLASWMLAAIPGATVDAVDINGQVVSAATECFGLPKDDHRLHTHVQDGMQFFKGQTRPYDIVMLDVTPLPYHFRKELTTIRSRMSEHGVLVVNGWKSDSEFQALQQDVIKTFARVWLATDSREGNQILLARFGSMDDLPVAEELRTLNVPDDAIAWSAEQPWKQLK